MVVGIAVPRSTMPEVLSSGAFRTVSSAPPRPGDGLWDDTLVSSMAGEEKARDVLSLSASLGAREFPSEEEGIGISRGGLKSMKEVEHGKVRLKR